MLAIHAIDARPQRRADSAAAVPPPSSAVEMDGTSGDDWSAFLMAAEGI